MFLRDEQNTLEKKKYLHIDKDFLPLNLVTIKYSKEQEIRVKGVIESEFSKLKVCHFCMHNVECQPHFPVSLAQAAQGLPCLL